VILAREALLADAVELFLRASVTPPAGRIFGLKTSWERAAEKREAKLESVREQVESGSLVIRQMTDDERRQFPPLPPRPASRFKRPSRPYGAARAASKESGEPESGTEPAATDEDASASEL